jgi:Tol biopolymer transport system component
VDGTGMKRMTTSPRDDFSPSWSPDEIQIVYNSRYDGKYEVCITDGKSDKRITFSDGAAAYNPVWSPDGKQIVYYSEKGDGKDQVHVVNPDGTNDMNLTMDTLHNYFPGWTHNNQIVFTQDTKGSQSRAVIMDRDGKDRKYVLNINSFYTRFSPDGSMIAYIIKQGEIKVVASKSGKELKSFSLLE